MGKAAASRTKVSCCTEHHMSLPGVYTLLSAMHINDCCCVTQHAQHSTAQHSTAQHSTAQHSTAQHSTAHVQQAEQSTTLKLTWNMSAE